MQGFLGLTVIVIFSFMIGGPLGFLVLGSLIGLAIATAKRKRRKA